MRKFLIPALLWPGALQAHGLGSTEGYEQTLVSMLDSVYAPVILLLIAGYALMAGTAGKDASRQALTGFAAGLILGFPLAEFLGPQGAYIGLTLGMLCALHAAASLNLPHLAVLLAVIGGAAATIHNLDGHPLHTLPLATHLGVFLGPALLAAALTGWTGMIWQALPAARILLRIVSSWAFAANAIYLAFLLKP